MAGVKAGASAASADSAPAPVDAPATPSAPPHPENRSAVRVTALQNRRFRAGLEFGREPRLFRAADLDDERLRALIGDPLLMVEATIDMEAWRVLGPDDLPAAPAAD